MKADEIIKRAEEEAKQIAVNAYEVAKDYDFYKKALKAIEDSINGYGLEFLKPTESILDKLAKDYSFSETGKELAKAREITKAMVVNPNINIKSNSRT